MRRQFAVLAAVAFLFLGSGSAQAFLIDGFGDAQGPVTDSTIGGTVSDTLLNGLTDTDFAATADRMIEVDKTGGGAGLEIEARVVGGTYNHSQDAGAQPVQGTSKVTWSDFGTVDLTDGGASLMLIVDVLFADQAGGMIDITLFNGAASATESLAIPQVLGPPQSVVFLLSGFGAIDKTMVDKISMLVDGTSVGALDVTIDIVETAVPEPGTVLLLGSGLLGLGLWGRRRMKGIDI